MKATVGIYKIRGRQRSYLCRWYGLPDETTGKRPRFCESFKTAAEAKAFRSVKEAELKNDDGAMVEETLKGLCDSFLQARKPHIRPASLDLYRYTTEHLVKHFGPDRLVRSIRAKDADLFLSAQEYRHDGKTKLST